jgi:hypothetical protein
MNEELRRTALAIGLVVCRGPVEPQKGWIEAAAAAQQSLGDLRPLLLELYGQVDQARQGFGIYPDSPSMDAVMTEVGRALGLLRPDQAYGKNPLTSPTTDPK